MKCDVIPFTDCKMTMKRDKVCMESEMEPAEFPTQICETRNKTVQHTKFKPECKYVG